jgi:transmembrane sensor
VQRIDELVSAGSGSGADIDAQATAWAIRSAERPLDSSESQALEAWLSDSRHLGAYVRAQALWLDIDRVASLDSGSRIEAPVVEERPRRWPRYAMAASLALTLLGGGIAYDQLAGRIATGKGEVREIALEDGSTVVLNGDSVIQVRYENDVRRIMLRRGEAFFKVAHNKARPFIVDANGLAVRAVGTEFAVGVENAEVEVTVEQGVVAVAGVPGNAAPRFLHRNEQFVAAETGPRKALLETADVERMTAWRKGLLVFQGQPLGKAAADVNRHSDLHVVIDDPTLARAEFMGVFKIGDSRGFATAAARAFNADVVQQGQELRLVRQQNSPSH